MNSLSVLVFIFCTILQLNLAADTPASEVPVAASASLNNPECNLATFDEKVQWIFYFGHPTRRIPKNQTEVKDFCDLKDKNEKMIDDFANRCLTSLSKTVTQLLMFGVIRQNKYYCSSSNKGPQDYINSARCIENIKVQGDVCMNSLIVDMLSVLSAPTKKRMGRMCCSYYRFEDCLMQASHEKCKARDIKRFEDLIHGYTGQMLNTLCVKYPKESDCSKLYPKREWTEARRLVRKRYKQLPVSFLPPLIDVFSSLPSR